LIEKKKYYRVGGGTYELKYTKNVAQSLPTSECEIYHCRYEISGCYTNGLFNVNTMHERKLFRPRKSQKYFASVYRVYSVSTDDTSKKICEAQYTIQRRRFMTD
jgi:hypothetical protein